MPFPEETSTTAAGKNAATKGRRVTRAPRLSAKKTAAGTAAKKRAAKPRTKSATPAEPSDADIRLRAYFIAERRVQLALQGDPAKDWLEAKQQLAEEAQQAR